MHSPCVWIALLLERKGGWLKRGQSSDGVCVGPLGIERNVFGGYDDTAYVDKVVPGAFFLIEILTYVGIVKGMDVEVNHDMALDTYLGT